MISVSSRSSTPRQDEQLSPGLNLWPFTGQSVKTRDHTRAPTAGPALQDHCLGPVEQNQNHQQSFCLFALFSLWSTVRSLNGEFR